MLSFQHDLYPCQILPFSLHCSLFSAEYISSLSVLVARSVQFSQFSCSVISVVSNSFAPPLDLACQSPWAFPGKNTGLGCHFLLQRIFPTQGSNPHLLHLQHRRQILLPSYHLGSPSHHCSVQFSHSVMSDSL